MGFQNNVQLQQGFGVPGELFNDGPHRAQSYIITTPTAQNIIGQTYCTILQTGEVQAGGVAGTPSAGFLVDPKDQANVGQGGSALTPTMLVPQFAQCECLSMGSIVVNLPNAANIGDVVIYNTSTGAISSQSPSAAIPAGSAYANAIVDYFDIASAGLAVITVTPQQNPYVAQ